MNRKEFLQGVRDGMPVCFGYAAVAFSLGIAMRNAGMDAVQGFFMSLFNLASAGEYAGVRVIAENGTYLEIALMTLVANARYLLMSCSLSQKYSEDIPMFHRMANGYAITDEIFALAIARHPLDPWYYYGVTAVSAPGWAAGTAAGIIAGNILPVSVVNALSVALYGMFIAIIIPPARKDRAILILVLCGFLCSYLSMHFLSFLSEGTRIIILTVVLASAAAIIRPVKEEEDA